MVSILCCYNQPDTFRTVLEASSAKFTGVELLAEENAAGEPIPSVLNRLARRASGDIVCFVHQDAWLASADWPTALVHTFTTHLDAGVIGVIGKRRHDVLFTGSILQSDGTFLGTPVTEPLEVQTVDEVCFGMPRQVFEQWPLDEGLDLHCYAADACLQVARAGLKVYVMPTMVQHQSRTLTGDVSSPSFHRCQTRLIEKWRCSVNTTVGLFKYPDLLEDVENLSPESADVPLSRSYAQEFRPQHATLSAVQLRINNWAGQSACIQVRLRESSPDGRDLASGRCEAPAGRPALSTVLFDNLVQLPPNALKSGLMVVTHCHAQGDVRCVVHPPQGNQAVGPALVSDDGAAWEHLRLSGRDQVLAFRSCY